MKMNEHNTYNCPHNYKCRCPDRFMNVMCCLSNLALLILTAFVFIFITFEELQFLALVGLHARRIHAKMGAYSKLREMVTTVSARIITLEQTVTLKITFPDVLV